MHLTFIGHQALGHRGDKAPMSSWSREASTNGFHFAPPLFSKCAPLCCRDHAPVCVAPVPGASQTEGSISPGEEEAMQCLPFLLP